jgi:hypothetical protein
VKNFPLFTFLILTALLALAPAARALSKAEAAAGRAVLQRYADAIVGVEMVVTLKGMQGDRPLPSREQKREINGTFVSPTGLTVLSLGSIDPRNGLPPGMLGQMRFEEPEFKEVKLRLANGTEIPARMVLKDADLDLVFIAPESPPAAALPFVDLTRPAKPVILDTYYDISRSSKAAQRVPAVRVVNVIGIIEKPRQYILASDYSPGCPVFDGKGNLLGISVRHVAGGQAAGIIILPAAGVAEIAAQAAAIKWEPAAAASAETTP